MKTQIIVSLALLAAGCMYKHDSMSSPTASFAEASVSTDSVGGSGGEAEVESAKTLPAAGQLTAGEWSDIHNWEYWRELLGRDDVAPQLQSWGFTLDQRFDVRATAGDGARPNVAVQLLDADRSIVWQARTDVHGDAVVFAAADARGPFSVRVGDVVRPIETGERTVVDGEPARAEDAVDVMFVVDATSSMSDELSYIQGELVNVAQRIGEKTKGELKLRLAANVYRDEGDDYVVRASPFSEDVNKTVGFIKKQSAGGGGDFPEAVHSGLEDAIHEHRWNPAARARIAFLVLDAPPHTEHAMRIRELTQDAAGKGIRVVPVVASGIDKSTEFLMRSIAIATNGTYVFLTNHSGIGNAHLEPTVGDYEVERLNDLLVRIVVEAAS